MGEREREYQKQTLLMSFLADCFRFISLWSRSTHTHTHRSWKPLGSIQKQHWVARWEIISKARDTRTSRSFTSDREENNDDFLPDCWRVLVLKSFRSVSGRSLCLFSSLFSPSRSLSLCLRLSNVWYTFLFEKVLVNVFSLFSARFFSTLFAGKSRQKIEENFLSTSFICWKDVNQSLVLDHHASLIRSSSIGLSLSYSHCYKMKSSTDELNEVSALSLSNGFTTNFHTSLVARTQKKHAVDQDEYESHRSLILIFLLRSLLLFCVLHCSEPMFESFEMSFSSCPMLVDFHLLLFLLSSIKASPTVSMESQS